MEQQYGQVPPRTGGGVFRNFWHVWGPLIIKWGIGMGISMLAMFALCLAYATNNEAAMSAAINDEDKMMSIYNDIYVQYIHFATFIEGAAAVITIPVMAVLFHRDRVLEKRRGVPPVKKASPLHYIAIVILSLTLSMGLNNLIIIGNLSSYSEAYTDTMTALYSASLPVQIVALGILVPICEELVFRGLVYKRIRENSTCVAAMLYSSLLFGVFHANFVQMLYGFFLGVVLVWVYEKYGSIWAPITAHIVMNILSVLATEYKLYDFLAKDIRYIGGATIACAAIASCMYLWIQRMEPEEIESSEHADGNN